MFQSFLTSANCLDNKCDDLSKLLFNPILYDNTLIVSLVGIFGFFLKFIL